MAEPSWLQTFGVALTGGLTVKVLDIVYQEIRRRASENQSAVKFVDEHLDPLLKAADELNGKMRSLAEGDFKSLRNASTEQEKLNNYELAGLLFLFGKFWAQIEIIRQKGMSVAMSKDKRGARLQTFFDCLESRRVRILDRSLQRAVGELFIRENGTINFIEFVSSFEKNEDVRRWMMSLGQFLSRMGHTSERQQLLQYGIVVHALIDNLDPNHLVTRERPSWPNKLSRRSWRDLKYRVFKVYLNFVTNSNKYIGPPKKAAHKQTGKAARRDFEARRLGTSVGLPLFRWCRERLR
jgi:hypothetical protein